MKAKVQNYIVCHINLQIDTKPNFQFQEKKATLLALQSLMEKTF